MIQVYTGNGKGKTTAALGTSLRAIGAGKKVLFIQFLKDGQSSEISAIKKYLPGFEVKSFGRKGILTEKKIGEKDYDFARQGLILAQKAIQEKLYNLIVLDEINTVVDLSLLDEQELLNLIKSMPREQELILTGRGAPKSIIRIAHLVTEMQEIKHYYTEGVQAREGIEY